MSNLTTNPEGQTSSQPFPAETSRGDKWKNKQMDGETDLESYERYRDNVLARINSILPTLRSLVYKEKVELSKIMDVLDKMEDLKKELSKEVNHLDTEPVRASRVLASSVGILLTTAILNISKDISPYINLPENVNAFLNSEITVNFSAVYGLLGALLFAVYAVLEKRREITHDRSEELQYALKRCENIINELNHTTVRKT